LAHKALFDLGFLAMARTRLGIACPPPDVCDTLDIARRLYPAWPRHSLERVAARLKIATRAEHRALADARLVKEIFLAMLNDRPTVNTLADVMRVSRLLTFADAPVCGIELPSGFEALSTAIAERCAITMVYEHGWQRPQSRLIPPRLVLEVHGVAYVIAHGHRSEAERTFRLDRIRECWLPE
jgi:DNA polymerase III epsilon subunit-like protein